MNDENNNAPKGTAVIKDPAAVAARYAKPQPELVPRSQPQAPDATREADEAEYEEYVRRAAQSPGLVNRGAQSTISPSMVHEVSKVMPALPSLPLLRIEGDGIRPPDLRLQQTLGQGGKGIVYLATQNPLSRNVAVKTSRPTDDPEAPQDLIHEAMVTGYLEHPNIIPIHFVGRDEGGEPLIVMKRVEGVTWNEVMADPLQAPSSNEEIIDLEWHLEVLLQVCNAVRFAHSRNVVHRDIKPENVMLGTYGEVYLLDWGISLSFSATDKPPFLMTTHESLGIAGTPAYMAPEMTRDSAEDVDVRSDIFLLGGILYELLTGQAPNGFGSLPKVLMNAYRCEPKKYPTSAPPELVAIARRAMARDMDERFASVDEFRDAILRHREQREAMSLIREAERRLLGIEPNVHNPGPHRDDSALAKQLIEARFALQQALDKWPDSPVGLAARSRACKLSFEFHLQNDEFGSAAAALKDIHHSESEPYQRRLDEAVAQRGTERERYDALKKEFDPRVALTHRIQLGVGFALIWGALATYKAWSRWGVPLDQVDPKYLLSIIPTIGVPTLLMVILRHQFASNAFNRRVFWLLVSGFTMVSTMRVAGWAFDAPAYIITSMEFILYTFFAFYFGALLGDRRAMIAATPIGAATLLAMAFPMYQYGFMAAAFLIYTPVAAWAWTRETDPTGTAQ